MMKLPAHQTDVFPDGRLPLNSLEVSAHSILNLDSWAAKDPKGKNIKNKKNNLSI
jgi:hypothetical protein